MLPNGSFPCAPPAPPSLQSEPRRPVRALYRSEYEYLAAVEAWALVVDRVREENQRRRALYQQNVEAYYAAQRAAGEVLSVAEAAISQCDVTLNALRAAREQQEGPLKVERVQATKEIRRVQAVSVAAAPWAKAAAASLRGALWRANQMWNR